MKYKIGQRVTIIGLLPFKNDYNELLHKVGTVLYIDVYKPYPIFLLIENKIIAVNYDCIKYENHLIDLGK